MIPQKDGVETQSKLLGDLSPAWVLRGFRRHSVGPRERRDRSRSLKKPTMKRLGTHSLAL